MEIYIKLFEVLFPVFFIVGIGYFIGKKDPKVNTNFITKFTGNIGFPGLVFYSLFYLCYNNDCWFCDCWAFSSFFS